jgi:hypothetical protein
MVAHPAAVLETLDRSDLTSRITRPRGRPVAQADSDNLSVGQQCKASYVQIVRNSFQPCPTAGQSEVTLCQGIPILSGNLVHSFWSQVLILAF